MRLELHKADAHLTCRLTLPSVLASMNKWCSAQHHLCCCIDCEEQEARNGYKQIM